MPIRESVDHVFRHTWENISVASWQKYPSETRPDVLSVDLIERNFDSETGVLSATRVVIMQDRVPRILKPVFGNGSCICVENSIVDPKTKTMILKSKNITYEGIVTIEETCTYTVNPENPEWTNLRQEAIVHAYPFGVAGKIEKFLAGKFVANAPLGREIMETAVNRVEVRNSLKERLDSLISETKNIYLASEKKFDDLKEDLSKKFETMENDIRHRFDDSISSLYSEWNTKVKDVESLWQNHVLPTLNLNTVQSDAWASKQ